MCNNNDCPLFGGACGMQTVDGKSGFVMCNELTPNVEVNAYVATHVAVSSNGEATISSIIQPTEADAVRAMAKEYFSYCAHLDAVKGGNFTRFSARCEDSAGTKHYWHVEHCIAKVDRAKLGIRDGEVRVSTPVGVLVARNQDNPDFPGIMVDLECKVDGEHETIGIANIEWGSRDYGHTRQICAGLFRDLTTDDCTDYLGYNGTNEMFGDKVPAVLVGVMQDGHIKQSGCMVDVTTGKITDIIDRTVCAARDASVLIDGQTYPAHVRNAEDDAGNDGLVYTFDA